MIVDPPDNQIYMEIIRKHDKQISTFTWFCLDLSYIAY